jgi:uncharacterized protein (DUF983 family)
MPYRVENADEPRSMWAALRRGLAQRCPACGTGRLFRRYLKVDDTCPACGEALHHQRADDAPPYFTILIVGHVVVPFVLLLEQQAHPPLWVHYALWLPLVFALTFALLPRIKGAVVGIQWANRMHGFGETPDPEF